MTLPMAIFPRFPKCAPPTPETIHVQYKGEWTLFTEWLISFVGERPMSSEVGYEAQNRM
jgi:hypothetical protein